MEAHTQIERRPNPFQCINGAALKGGVQLAWRDVRRAGAQFCQNFTGKARNTHFQTFQIFQTIDLFLEPTAHLVTGITARKAQDIELAVDFFHQFHTAAVIEPGVLFRGCHTEWHGGEIQRIRYFAFPVIRGRVAHIVLAGTHHIEHTKSRLMFISRVDGDLQTTIRHFFSHGSHVTWSVTEYGEIRRPAFGQFQTVYFVVCLSSTEHSQAARSGYQYLFEAG